MAGVFGDGSAQVLGLPRAFDLGKALRSATSVKLATAFAHQSGWSLLNEGIEDSGAELTLIAGTDFMQTEPVVLSDWLRLVHAGRGSAHVSLQGKGRVFHPKVLIVRGPRSHWAIVGSGNLSRGGLQKNVECSVYLTDDHDVRRANAWFDGLLKTNARGSAEATVLTDEWLVAYTRKYKEAQRIKKASDQKLKKLALDLRQAEARRSHRWDKIASLVRKRVQTQRFRDRLEDWRRAAEIPELLNMPHFEFTKDDWRRFYGIHALGTLNARNIWKPWSDISRLRIGLRRLINEDLPIERRIDDLVAAQGRYKVGGVGINLATKILTVHQPLQWPVWNGEMRKLMAAMGYERPRASAGVKYAAFARDMRRVLSDTPAKDMIELDCVFYDEADQH